ncbi:variable surface lipoprotein [Mycoplasmopsis bovis]|uniref:variable surface lipoprotein n=1 Tax=Mycoplasmopsis bovis TaxID=28903 RepID=UPI00249E7185|nr:variable surface lipoprotein [Mycoplasmopsis bovis]
MKESKFLLLGSVASLASIPFVAAKCGETKEEKKPEGKNPSENTEPGKNPGENTEPGKNPSENTEPGKNPSENTEPDKNPGVDKNPGEENQTESDEEPKEEVEKAYWESIMEWRSQQKKKICKQRYWLSKWKS